MRESNLETSIGNNASPIKTQDVISRATATLASAFPICSNLLQMLKEQINNYLKELIKSEIKKTVYF